MDRLEELRAIWHKATEKDKPQDAVKALVELEKLDPNEPRWAQRLGESYRRLGQKKEAVDAFARAFERYFERGFLPRAIAMAKLVKSLDAARGDLLEQSLPHEPEPAKPSAPPPAAAPRVPPPAALKPPAAPMVRPPAPAQAAPAVKRQPPPLPIAARSVKLPDGPLLVGARDGARPPPLPVKPAPLTRAPDAAHDEVRFADAAESSISVLLTDFHASSVDLALVEDDESLPPTEQAKVTYPARPKDEPEAHEYDAYGAMATFRLLAALERDALVALADAAELVEFVPGAMIIVRDEKAFALYAIVAGTACVTVPNNPDVSLREGDIFGEACLLDEGRRQANVRAETPLMTLRIEKAALEEVMRKHPGVEDALFDLLARRLVTNLLHTSPLFSAFDPVVRLELAQKFEVRRAEIGTVLAERGRRSDGLYLLLIGNVMAEAAGAAPIRIARGTAFGHASLLGGTSDTTVRAESEAVLLRMPAAGFGALAALYPPALAHLSDTAGEPLPASQRGS